MKMLKLFSLFLFSTIVLLSCDKDDDDTPLTLSNLSGTYEGKYGNGPDDPNLFYAFNLKADGTMEEISVTGDIKGTGAWTIVGNTIKVTHHWLFPQNAFFVTVGQYDISSKKITGTWGYGSSETDGGKWFMTKKP